VRCWYISCVSVIRCWNYAVDCGTSSQLCVRSVQACGEKTSLQLLDAEEEGTTFALNFGDCIPGDTVWRRRTLESLAPQLREPKTLHVGISQLWNYKHFLIIRITNLVLCLLLPKDWRWWANVCRPRWVLALLYTGGESQLISENSHVFLNDLYLLWCSELSVWVFVA